MEWIQMAVQIAITALVAALILLVEHYAPGKVHNPVINYVLGVLALIIPLSGLMVIWQLWLVVIAIWSVVTVGGVAVMVAYAVDSYLAMRLRVKTAEAEAQLLRPEVIREVEHGETK